MKGLGKPVGVIFLIAGLTVGLGSCSGGGGSGGGFKVSQALQNMTLDPSGLTIDVTFSGDVDPITAALVANYTGSGGQSAQSATVQPDNRTVRVVLDAVAVPGDGTLLVSGIQSALGKLMNAQTGIAIRSTDTTRPTVVTVEAEAIANAANDEVRITFDEGMAPDDMADLSFFAVQSPTGSARDVTGSTMSYDSGTNVLTIVLDNAGGDADDLQYSASYSVTVSGARDLAGNAVASVTVSGTVSGDSALPSVSSITQNLSFDPLGKTVDVLFDEDIEVATGEVRGNYIASEGQNVTDVSVAGAIARVQLTAPAVPGTTTFNVDGVKDRAGNSMIAASAFPVSGTDSTAPSVSSYTATAIAGRYNDTIEITFDEAMVPADVTDISRYAFYSPDPSAVTLTGAALTYDEATYTATITLTQTGASQVNFQTGDVCSLEVTNVRDVAGNPMLFAQMAGNIVGDSTAPTFIAAYQDTNLDPTGSLIGFMFDEDIADATAVIPANYAASGGQTATLSAVFPWDGSILYVVFDGPVVPGVHTVDVLNQMDVAGNVGTDYTAQAVVPFDTTAPQVASVTGQAIPGAGNDRITVTFTEAMYPPDVTDPTHYSFQNPAGSLLSITSSSVNWDEATWTATFVLDETGAAQDNLVPGQQLVVDVNNVRDIGGNQIGTPAQATVTVTGDGSWPQVVIAWQNTSVSTSTVDVVFSEALEQTSAEVLTNWSISSAGGLTLSTAALVGSDDVVRLTFSAAVTPGTDTLSFQNIRDKAGNQLPPVQGLAIATSETTGPSMSALDTTTVVGAGNDTIEIGWDEDIHPGDAVDPARYGITDGGSPIPASTIELATISYDQATTTVTITFGHACGYNLTTSAQVGVVPNGVRDIRGNLQGVTSGTDLATGGDSTTPTASAAQLYQQSQSSITVTFDEEIDPATVDAGDFVHATLSVTDVAVLEGRTVLVTFDGDPVVGVDTVDVSGIDDLAGNTLGLTTMAIATSDTTAPTATVTAEAVSGWGNDVLTVQFSEPVQPSSATNPSMYGFQSPAGTALSLTGASFVYDSTTATTTITLPQGVYVKRGASFLMDFQGIEDLHLNTYTGMASGTVGGDSQAPSFVGADRNLDADPTGWTVDVSFDEAMDPTACQSLANWSISGSLTLSSSTVLHGGHTIRLVFDAAVTPGTETLSFSNLSDLAGNAIANQMLIPIRD